MRIAASLIISLLTLVTTGALAESQTFPVGFQGDNVENVFRKLKQAGVTAKSEFESTSTYEERLTTILGTKAKDFQREMSFVFNNSRLVSAGRSMGMSHSAVSYDADAKMLYVRIYDYIVSLYPSIVYGFVWSQQEKEVGSYVGSNAFGAKRAIKKLQTQRVCIIIDVRQDDPSTYLRITVPDVQSFSLRQKNTIAVSLTGRLVQPYTYESRDHIKPEIDFPFDKTISYECVSINLTRITIFDSSTGLVLRQLTKDEVSKSFISILDDK